MELPERIRAVLSAAGLTLHQVSLESKRLFKPDSPALIPHTLYHSVANSRGFRPNLHQVAALSRISGYRLEDWLIALGFDLERLAALECALPLKRTRIIDPSFSTLGWPIPVAAQREDKHTDVVPFAEILRDSGSAGRTILRPADPQGCVFARLGVDDAFAFPELLPGSIVRANPRAALGSEEETNREPGRLLLIQHERGYWCGRFHRSGKGKLRVAASHLAYAHTLFSYPDEARVIGAVDMEFRWMDRNHNPQVPQELLTYQRPQPLIGHRNSLREVLSRARSNANLTLAEASELSRRISRQFDDQHYAISQSTLADYETRNNAPRHLQKVLTLCVIYGVTVLDFVAASGISRSSLGHNHIPAGLLWESNRNAAAGVTDTSSIRGGDEPCGSVPTFLRECISGLAEIPRPSLRDLFWLTGHHPYLPAFAAGSRLALVNRRRKKPVRDRSLPVWQQPAYVLWERSGRYLCACCSSEKDELILYPASTSESPHVLRRDDVEVIGQIVAIARYVE